jgi:peptide/nickel transport system permease protein
VISYHALANALIPLVTLIALDLPALFAGAVFTETIFSWPGMGRLFYQSALRRDYPVLMAVVMITAVLIVLSNLIADIIYGYLDPRIRYE